MRGLKDKSTFTIRVAQPDFRYKFETLAEMLRHSVRPEARLRKDRFESDYSLDPMVQRVCHSCR